VTADPVERFFPPRAERSVLEFVFDRYPFPLALTYRRLHAEMDGQEPIAAAWQLRDAFECLLRFTACLAVADLLRARPAPEWAGALVGLLFKPRGLSLGDWHTLLEDALRPPGHLMPAQRQLAGPRALPGLPELLFRTDGARTELNRRIDGDRDSFVHWRNRVFGHGVFQQERRWYADETLRWLPPLHGFYEALRPLLTEWTLVSDAPGGGEVSWTGAETPRMTRPHEHVPLGEPRLMRLRRTLGARTEDGDLPLGPLLSVQPCGICAQPAAFFFDRYERDRNRHRSFFLEYERGHGSEQRGWDEVRRLAALLPPGFEWERGSYDREEIVEGVEIVFRDFGREYLRPAYLLDAIWRVVAEHPKGYLHVVGPTGTGKTYLVRGLEQEGAARRAPVLPYHVLAGVSTDYRTFLVELVERARERLRFRTQEPQSKGESVAGLQAQLTEFLAELMRANRLDRLIVAIDGLDELPDPDQNGAAITDLLPAAERLPQGCFVLLTGREALRPRVRQGLERLARDPTLFVTVPLTPGGPANRDLVRAYLGEHLPQPFRDPVAVEAALVRSGGVFLYAHHLAEALAAGVFSDVTALPEGPQFYPAYLARLRERVGEGLYERVYLPTLLFLSAARQPVPLTQLQTWGIPRDHLPLALLDLRDFLRVHRAAEWHDSLGEAPTESRYALAHEAFVRFVREDDRLSAEWRGAHATVGRLALVSFTGRWRELDPTDDGDLYALRFTPHHLEQAGLTDAVAGLYGDDGYGIACLEATVVALAQARPQIALDLSVLGVAAFRELVERRGRREHAGKLVEALGQLGRVLRELRRLTEAVATFEEAIAMCRQPDIAAEWSGADTTLAHLLNGKGVVLENLGSLKAAAVCHGEAVRIFSRLVEEKGRHALAAEVATSLDNLGIVLRQLGKDDEALSCHGEAVRIYRIATEAMGGRVLAAHLALALDNFAQALMDSGRAGEAVTPSDEAVRLLRQLVEEGPAGLAPDLAIALGNRSKILRRLGRLADANTCGDESVRVYRRLIHEEGRSELTSGLAVALDTQGLALEALGRLDEGLAAYDEAIRLYRQLGETGGRPELAQDLANALGHRGSVLNSLGRLEEAVASLEESIATRRRLVEQGRQDQVEDLAAGLGRLGTALHSLGRLPEALVEYDEAVRFYEALAEGPAGGDVVASLAIVLNNKARALEGLERWDEALRTYEMSLARLWPTDPRRGVPFPPYLLWTIGYQIRILFNLDRWDLAAQDLGRAVQVLGSFPRDMNDPIAQAGARALDALIGLVRGLPPAARARLDAAIAGQKWAGIVRSWLAS
jgi:tetratricopeptide (TPR) repeat protein